MMMAQQPQRGRTYIYDRPQKRMSQDGLIRRIWTTVRTTGGEWKFAISSKWCNFDFVAESPWIPSATGLQAHDLTYPLP
jgi:hypothetical protein